MHLSSTQTLDSNLRPNARLANSLSTAIPPPMEVNTVQMGPAGERQNVRIYSEGSDTYGSSNNIIRFKPTSSAFLDFRRATLNVFVSAQGTGGTYLRFANGIWNIIERERVFWNGKLIYDNHDKNIYRSMNFAFNRDKSVDTTFGEIWGLGDQADRETWAPGKVYEFPLNITVLEQEEIPAWKYKELTIELTLASPSRILETDHTSFSYTVTNPYLRVDEVRYEKSWHDYIDSSTLYWCHPTYQAYTFNNKSANFQDQIPHRSQGIERIFCIIKHTDDLTDPTVDDKFYTFHHDNCKEFQTKIDNDYYPRQPVKASNASVGDPDKYYEAYYHFLNTCHRTFLNDSLSDKFRVNLDIPYNNFNNVPITPDEFVTDKFIMSQDFMTFLYNSNDFISKQDWSGSNVKVLFNCKFNSPPTDDQTIFCFVVYKAVFVIPPDGNAFIIQ